MATEHTRTSDPTSTDEAAAPAGEVVERARGSSGPSTVTDEAAGESVAARAPRQFEPTCRRRLENLFDGENGYSG